MLGLYFWSWSRRWSNNWCCFFLLAETVGNTYAQHAVVWTNTNGVAVADVVNPLVFQTGSDVTGHSPLNATSEYWGNTGVMVVASVAVAGVSAPYHAAQTGVHVQIVGYWVTQFSGQLYALCFESAIGVVAFVWHTT
ncbi:Uncharacterised protein [Klebsiella pneumoniae]|nr:Uncharacterised protein [Klebsiella pneumoniae]